MEEDHPMEAVDPAEDTFPTNNNNDNDDEIDDTPAFINQDDAVEVQVDDDNVPMDDDDDDNVDDDNMNAEGTSTTVVVADMSRYQITSHAGPVYAIASHYNPTTQQLSIVSGGGDDKAYLHHVTTSNNSSTNTANSQLLPHNHTDSVSSVAFNLDYIPADATDVMKNPRFVAVGAYDGAICLYQAETGELMQQLEGPTDVEWLAFHPKGGTVLLAGSAADGTVWMFHLSQKQNKCLQVFVGHESAVTDGAFSLDGRWAITCSSDGTARIWAPRTGQSKHVFRFHPAGDESPPPGLTTMAIGGGTDQQLVLLGAEDGQAHVCHIGTKKVVVSLRHYEIPDKFAAGAMNDGDEEDDMELPMSVEAVGFAPSNPNWCATGGVDGILKIWDLALGNGQCRQVCRPPNDVNNTENNNNNIKLGGITRLTWHPTLPLVLTSSTAGAINVWDARNGQLLHTQTGGSTEVVNALSVQFINEGRTAVVVTGSDDNTVKVHELDMATIFQQATVLPSGQPVQPTIPVQPPAM